MARSFKTVFSERVENVVNMFPNVVFYFVSPEKGNTPFRFVKLFFAKGEGVREWTAIAQANFRDLHHMRVSVLCQSKEKIKINTFPRSGESTQT